MKKIRILIITLIIILVLGCATFATLYFATDMFKSDKDMFYKYISQITLKEFIDLDGYNNYNKRLRNDVHTSKGEISIEVMQDGETDIDEKFEYSSQTDPKNKLASSNIDFKRDGKSLLTVDYLRNEELYGLKFKDLVSQYIVVENNNLKEFASKLGIEDNSSIPNKIELSDYDYSEIINEEELEQIIDKYINIMISEISDESYSKIAKGNITLGDTTIQADGYKVTIDLKTLQAIFVKVVATMENDEQVFNLLNSIAKSTNQEIDFEEYKENLQIIKETLSEELEENSENITISVYKQGKKTVKVCVQLSTEGEVYLDFSINKINDTMNINGTIKELGTGTEYSFKISKIGNSDDNDNYKAEYIVKEDEEQLGSVNFSATRNGKLDSNNIQNNIELNIKSGTLDDIEINVGYKNNITFNSDIEIEKFNNENSAVINEFSNEQLNNLFVNLGNMLNEKIDFENGIIGVVVEIMTGQSIFDSAQNATIETSKQAVYEATALAKAEILSDFYSNDNFDNSEISEQYIREKVAEYMGDYVESENIVVTKTAGKEEYVITVSGMDLDTSKTTIDLSALQND